MRSIVRADDADRLAGGGLVAVRVAGIAALASTRDTPVAATEHELREHDAIALGVHRTAASLPARFGTVFVDAAALAGALEARAEALGAALAGVGTRVELSVTLSWRDAAAPERAAPASGREFLLALAARERERREADRLVARLIDELSVERANVRHQSCPRTGVAAIVALLVERDEVDGVRQAIASFGERAGDARVAVYGPLPPYSFAS